MRVLVSTDGFVADDGSAAWAFVAFADGVTTASRSGMLSRRTASHLAEWTAMRQALAWAEESLEEGELELRTDSALVAKGLASRRPEMSGEAAALRAECRQALARLAARGVTARVVRVRREENEAADGLARDAAGQGAL
ncbi:MAG TPA: reverse transcriptase-like protein [Candidatus Thermoplasmatota archaeon]|nr:reverse transcriptase-like protein [Candidatus Thermoplasmatota archaeon]